MKSEVIGRNMLVPVLYHMITHLPCDFIFIRHIRVDMTLCLDCTAMGELS